MIREFTHRAQMSRDRAHTAALAAIRLMLRGLEAELEGGRLEGLPKLGKSSTMPYRALPVRAMRERNYQLKAPMPGEMWGRSVLCLSEYGRLVFARMDSSGQIEEEWADLNGLRAEDVEHVAETMVHAVELHVQATNRKSENYHDLERLADRIRLSLELDESIADTRPGTGPGRTDPGRK